MKTIIALTVLLTSSAFAAKIISTEPSIVSTQGVKVKVSNLCVNGDQVESKVAVEYCTRSERVLVPARRRSESTFETVCLESEIGKLTHPINYMKATCHRELIREGDDRYLSECTYTYAPAVLPLSYTFDIYKTTRSQTDYDVMTGQGLRKIKTKTVNLPACN